MRRAIAVLAVVAAALSALSASASAAPTVKFKAEAVPISGFPHTGNFYGRGAAVKAEYTISGEEYGGFPPPLIGVTFYLPSGVKLHTGGWKTCAPSVLEPSGQGPVACPEAHAGPTGNVLGVVAFGKERVPEEATLESFYAAGGGLLFFTPPLSGVAGNPLQGPLHEPGRGRWLRPEVAR
jgi:hypothetical protein